MRNHSRGYTILDEMRYTIMNRILTRVVNWLVWLRQLMPVLCSP